MTGLCVLGRPILIYLIPILILIPLLVFLLSISLLLRPRILVDVEKVTTATTILGHKINSPICVAPTAFHGMAHDDAEKATARGKDLNFNCLLNVILHHILILSLFSSLCYAQDLLHNGNL